MARASGREPRGGGNGQRSHRGTGRLASGDASGAANFITTIGGFAPNQFAEGRLPTPLTELDAAFPDQSVFMQVGFTGPAATNTY